MKTLKLFKRVVPSNQQTSPCCPSWLRATTILLLAVALLGSSAQAATVTWDGGSGGNANWDTAGNWDIAGTPLAADTVVFATAFTSGTGISLNGDRTINDLSITTTTDFSLDNNVLTITSGDITRSAASGTTTINSGIALGAAAVWDIQGAGTLTVSGGITGGASLTKSGSGTLNLNAANTGTGSTTLSGGTLQLGSVNALGQGGFNFAGGILNANNMSDSSIGALSLTASSTLNLVADGTPGWLSFTDASRTDGILTINNWSGTPGGLGTDDKIIFLGTAPDSTFLSNVHFDLGVNGIFSGAMNGTELVPVPEPINVALGVFGVVFVGIGFARRLRLRARCQAAG